MELLHVVAAALLDRETLTVKTLRHSRAAKRFRRVP